MCDHFRSAIRHVTLCCGVAMVVLVLSGCGRTISVDNAGTSLRVRLSSDGVIEAIAVNGERLGGDFRAETLLENCTMSIVSSERAENGYRFVKTARHEKTGQSCRITEYLYPAGNSLRWEIEIIGDETPWSALLVTSIRYPAKDTSRYWVAWGRPQVTATQVQELGLKLMQDTSNNWLDPLRPVPFANSLYWYGAPHFSYVNPEIGYCPADFPWMKKKYYGAIFSIPMISVVERKQGFGLSVVLSPEEYTQDMTLETSDQGGIMFRRLFHRIVKTNTIRFSLDIVPHKADWRPGLEWTSRRYPEYFEPAAPINREMHGMGAYSTHDVAFDAQKMRGMAFSVNWRASFDFPYMGMFLPPVSNSTTWTSFGGKTASIGQMQAYSKKMKDLGFFVLNYFNVTEFGTRVAFPPPEKSTREGEQWKNCNDFMYKNFPDAILRVPEAMSLEGMIYPRTKHGTPFFTWEDAVAMDPGNKAYADFLMEQAQRHLERIPDSYGFCIDRMDWLRLFNERTDDGRSWFADKPVGSLVLSWQQFMDRLGPMVHSENKVIFVNNHTKRLDLLKHTDGFFDEFTYEESPLNLTAFTAIKKPFSGWTAEVKNLQKDGPDNFFQKYLYMGAFPMCPFPGNDHSIGPDPWADQQYLDYGPLMRMMKGREWVLEANPVSVDGSFAKANLFRIPDGHVVPVVFGERDTVTVRVAVPSSGKGPSVVAQYPGEDAVQPVSGAKHIDGKLVLSLPLKRGCAMVKISGKE